VGDTLGAVQQVAELACLLVLAALWTDSAAAGHAGF
jgi:cobalamin synthase